MCAAAVRGVVAIGGVVMFAAATSFAVQRADVERAVVLVTTYSDGRTVHHVVTSNPRHSWTPYFPRTTSAQRVDGLAVRALSFRRALNENGAVRVDVSALRGDGFEQEEPVATVIVNRDERVTIDALRAFDVMPVTFSLTTIERATLSQPRSRTELRDSKSLRSRQQMNPARAIALRSRMCRHDPR
jgi:hypothetical protein